LGIGKAVKNGWVSIDKRDGVSVCTRVAREVEDVVRKQLQSIRDGKVEELEQSVIDDLKKRKLISVT